jgi:hypothetical protein
MEGCPSVWASETVRAANEAFTGLSFTGTGEGNSDNNPHNVCGYPDHCLSPPTRAFTSIQLDQRVLRVCRSIAGVPQRRLEAVIKPRYS